MSELDAAHNPRAALDLALIDQIVQRLGLGAVREARDVGGAYNLNARLRTAGGDYVLRVYRPWMPRERLAQLQAIRGRLRAAGIPTAEIVADPTGVTIHEAEGRLIEVERYVPHDGTADTMVRHETALTWLGRLHDALGAAVDERALIPPPVANYGTPGELLAWLARAHATISTQSDQRRTLALALAEEAQRLLAELAEREAVLPRQAIHGDYGGQNLLFRGSELVGLLDFDFLAVRERAYELAYALYWIFVRLADSEQPARWPWALAHDALGRYDAATMQPLSGAERAALPDLLARVSLYWVAETAFLPHPAAALNDLAPNVATARWVIAHRDEIAEGLAN